MEVMKKKSGFMIRHGVVGVLELRLPEIVVPAAGAASPAVVE